MDVLIIKLTEGELTDVYHGLVIAMKELDLHRYGGGSDGLLADRLEVIVKKMEERSRKILTKSTK
ncbi:hypothetical protein [Chryseobacterium arthrosphaerae]|uniref:hypothetical protein n=1 Tax=Chryseobacterium arthrosphaerae TaxID=651561 RepID=UPI001F4B1078|nr:hypothetical protein [Chryseobacterium arthrosphaerae]